MARGGPRSGAGRPKGSGVGKPARKTSERIKITRESIGTGETPLEYMLRIMRTSNDAKRQDAMAVAAAGYIHPKLAAVEHSGNDEKPLSISVVSGVIREDADEHVNGDTVNH